MEKERFIRQKTEENDKNREIESAHQEAMGFVEKHRDFLEHYGRGQIKIEPAPEGLDTFAFDLKNNTIYVNSKFYKSSGFLFSDEKTLFATCHEIEHFSEKKQLLSEDGGEKQFENYLKKLEKSKAYGVMDNCLADIRENKTVIKRLMRKMPVLNNQCIKKIYSKKLILQISQSIFSYRRRFYARIACRTRRVKSLRKLELNLMKFAP